MSFDSSRKIEINNQIVNLRQQVRKARVRLIWRLTKEIKHLKSREHGDQKTIEKCHRKAEKLVKEVAQIKKLKEDDISKFAIINLNKNQQNNSELNDNFKTKAMCKLAFHKLLKNKIEEFRKNYPDYEIYLQSKKKTSSPTSSSSSTASTATAAATAPMMTKKVVEQNKSGGWLVEDIEDIPGDVKLRNDEEKSDDQSVNETDSGRDNFNELEPNVKARKKDRTKIRRNDDKNNFKDDDDDGVSDSLISLTEFSKQEVGRIKVVSKLAEVQKLKIVNDDCMEVDDVGIKSDDDKIDSDASDEEKNLSNDEEKREIDDFFLTTDNKNYLTYSVPKPQSFTNEESRNNNYHNKNNYDNNNRSRFNNKKKSIQSLRNDRNDHFNGKRNKRPPIKEHQVVERNIKRNVKPNEFANKETLHPSWAAKKKQQDMLKQGFQGKKIVFSDD